jgi:hypothetical protein
MNYTVVDPAAFTVEGVFRQEEFLDRIDAHDWRQYRDKMVLVRGCGDTLTPPWAFMVITGKLAGEAKSVRYGNEHDNVVVYRAERNRQRT